MMMFKKKFRTSAHNIKRLIEHNGGCIASDRITVDGCPVGYMYRDRPHNEADTGWRFVAGDESSDYMDDTGIALVCALIEGADINLQHLATFLKKIFYLRESADGNRVSSDHS